MVATAPARRPTYRRWEAALARAATYDIVILEVHGDHYVTSSRDGRRRHRTDGVRCDCEAARAGDAVCLHRAAVARFEALVADIASERAAGVAAA